MGYGYHERAALVSVEGDAPRDALDGYRKAANTKLETWSLDLGKLAIDQATRDRLKQWHEVIAQVHMAAAAKGVTVLEPIAAEESLADFRPLLGFLLTDPCLVAMAVAHADGEHDGALTRALDALGLARDLLRQRTLVYEMVGATTINRLADWLTAERLAEFAPQQLQRLAKALDLVAADWPEVTDALEERIYWYLDCLDFEKRLMLSAIIDTEEAAEVLLEYTRDVEVLRGMSWPEQVAHMEVMETRAFRSDVRRLMRVGMLGAQKQLREIREKLDELIGRVGG